MISTLILKSDLCHAETLQEQQSEHFHTKTYWHRTILQTIVFPYVLSSGTMQEVWNMEKSAGAETYPMWSQMAQHFKLRVTVICPARVMRRRFVALETACHTTLGTPRCRMHFTNGTIQQAKQRASIDFM
jgi:hypothetical protein